MADLVPSIHSDFPEALTIDGKFTVENKSFSNKLKDLMDKKVFGTSVRDHLMNTGVGAVAGSITRIVLPGGGIAAAGIAGGLAGAGREYLKQRKEVISKVSDVEVAPGRLEDLRKGLKKEFRAFSQTDKKKIAMAAGKGAAMGALGGLIGGKLAEVIQQRISQSAIDSAAEAAKKAAAAALSPEQIKAAAEVGKVMTKAPIHMSQNMWHTAREYTNDILTKVANHATHATNSEVRQVVTGIFKDNPMVRHTQILAKNAGINVGDNVTKALDNIQYTRDMLGQHKAVLAGGYKSLMEIARVHLKNIGQKTISEGDVYKEAARLAKLNGIRSGFLKVSNGTIDASRLPSDFLVKFS